MPAPSGAVLVGRLLPGSTVAAPLVDFSGNVNGPLRARLAVPVDVAAMERGVAAGQGAVLVFENGDPHLPIVIGLISSGQQPTPFQELLVGPRPTTVEMRRSPAEARVDGERVVIEGKREVVLKCGLASISLRSDGRVVVSGAYVETHSKGLNRIKGAAVKIN